MQVQQAKSLLGLKGKTTNVEVTKAHRKLALKYHPDKCNSENATKITQGLNAARDFLEKHQDKLSDEVKSRKSRSSVKSECSRDDKPNTTPRTGDTEHIYATISSIRAGYSRVCRLFRSAQSEVRQDAACSRFFDMAMRELNSYVAAQQQALGERLARLPADIAPQGLEDAARQWSSDVVGLLDQFQAIRLYAKLIGQTFQARETCGMHAKSMWLLLCCHLELTQGKRRLGPDHPESYTLPLSAVEMRLRALTAFLDTNQQGQANIPVPSESGFFVFKDNVLNTISDIKAFISRVGSLQQHSDFLANVTACLVCVTLEFDRTCVACFTTNLDIPTFEKHVRTLLEQLVDLDLFIFQSTGPE
ncbi:MAG: hypothetical protein Q9160_007772 [Pyrenula sp. 1 TL-2023]